MYRDGFCPARGSLPDVPKRTDAPGGLLCSTAVQDAPCGSGIVGPEDRGVSAWPRRIPLCSRSGADEMRLAAGYAGSVSRCGDIAWSEVVVDPHSVGAWLTDVPRHVVDLPEGIGVVVSVQ